MKIFRDLLKWVEHQLLLTVHVHIQCFFSLVISGNRFDKFPKVVLTYRNIVTLNFHNNALRSIPSDLTRLQQLRHLDLRYVQTCTCVCVCVTRGVVINAPVDVLYVSMKNYKG